MSKGCLGRRVATAVALVGLNPVVQVLAKDTEPGNPAAATASAPDPAAGGSEIIVTAQRRSERLSRTPVAVTAISGDALKRNAIQTQSDLQIAAPGLVVKASTNSNDLNFAIRGQSLDAFSGARPGVLPYFNEVQIGGQGTSSSFYDLQSIQVLKGPQGTLFGRNSTGGAVLFTSQEPKPELGGYILGSFGNFATTNIEGAINVPLDSEKFIVRVAAVRSTNDGYQRNIFNGAIFGGARREGVRGSVRWAPTDRIHNDLIVDYFHSQGTNQSPVLGSLNPAALFPVPTLYSNAVFPAGSGPLTGTSISDYSVSQILQGSGLPPAVANALAAGNYARFVAGFANPVAVPAAGIGQILANQQALGTRFADTQNPNTFRTKNVIVTDALAIQLSDAVTLKNIFGYTNLKSFSNVDYDGTPYLISDTGPGAADGNTVNAEQVSEELQLSGKTSRIQYVVGGYFSHEKTYNNLTSVNIDILLGGTRQFNVFNRLSTTFAGYSQGTYDLGGGLSATLGARLSNEKVGNDILPGATQYSLAASDPTVYVNDQSQTFTNVSWTLGLQYQVNRDLLLYVRSRRSYKNGGFNGTAAPKVGYGDVNGNAYRTETLTDLELGAKYDGKWGAMPVRFNLAAYNDWITNSQRTAYVLAPSGLVSVSVNVPRAKVTGVEFDGQITPVSWLRLGGSVNYIDARFTDGVTAVAGTTSLFATYPDTSKWSGSGYAEVAIPLGGKLTAIAHGDVFAQTKQFFSSAANLNPGAKIPGYALADFRVGIESERGWALSAIVKNAFDKEYYVGGLPLGALVGVNTQIPGTPRTFLVQGRFNF